MAPPFPAPLLLSSDMHANTHTHARTHTCNVGKYFGFENVSVKHLVTGLMELEYSFS